MKRIILLTSIAFIPWAGSQALAAQEASPRTATAIDRDADTMLALDVMGAALRERTMLKVHADITSEVVLASGQKIQSGGTVDMIVRRPDRFRVTIRDGRKDRDIYYDGRSLTVFAPALGHYASFAAPPTIAATLERANDEFGIEVPLADLFYWGVDPTLADRVRSAFRLGSDVVNGSRCAHYAIRQDQVDWQVWIREAGESLPCKLVITSKADPAMPQFTAVYSFGEGQSLDLNQFTFQPPKGASEISFKPANGRAPSQDR